MSQLSLVEHDRQCCSASAECRLLLFAGLLFADKLLQWKWMLPIMA